MVWTRRQFNAVAGLSILNFGAQSPKLFAQAAEASKKADKNDHALIVVELSGGNDGLNTVIPIENDLYYKNRRTLGVPKTEAIRIADQLAFHPSLKPLEEFFKAGSLAVVQGVGYPNPDRSHFRSMEIWHTASTVAPAPLAGWLGRTVDRIGPTPQKSPGPALSAAAFTGELPQALSAEKIVVPTFPGGEVGYAEDLSQSPEGKLLRKMIEKPSEKAKRSEFVRRQQEATLQLVQRFQQAKNAYQSTAPYPGTGLSGQLRSAVQALSADLGARIIYCSQGGYDTHSQQQYSHAQLLSDLAGNLNALQKDLEMHGLADRVCVLVFSEFGRRVDENASGGTDHGAASCLFVQGKPIKGGVYGTYPSLAQLGDGDLVFNTDFRTVYADLLDNWLACDSKAILAQPFQPLGLFGKKPAATA